MEDLPRRVRSAGLIAFCALVALPSVSAIAIEVPDAAWGAYGSYYDSANGLTGDTLKSRLLTIIDTGDVTVSYDAQRITLPITDRMPGTTAGQNRFASVYDRVSTAGTWDSGRTWNREHVWPKSRVDGGRDYDMFNIRPSLSTTNSGRGNNYYGGATLTGNVRLVSGSNSQFFPGDFDKGDVARACMYMATRYTALTLYNSSAGVPTANNDMGDLASMLRWHYLDLPDNFERRRNQYIYSNPERADSSGTYYSQRNRNPYVDHPEYVWAVFGDRANDSQITLIAPDAPASGGASTKNISLGRVIVGGATPSLSTSIALNKTGADPTTFSVTTTGLATADGTSASVRTNVYNAFDYGAGIRSLPVGLTGVTTATAGRKGGTITIDNTDLTTQANAANSGSLDGNDTVNLSLDVLDHSNASFAAGSDSNSLSINFGAVDKGATATRGFSLYNLLSTFGFTAGLDLDSIVSAGDTAMFGSGLSLFSSLNGTALAGGTSAMFNASFSPTEAGVFSATYTLGVSDENIAGAMAGTSLTLTLTGVATSFNVPEPTIMALTPVLAIALRRRRSA